MAASSEHSDMGASVSSRSPTEKNEMLILTFLRAAREIAVEAMALRRAMRKRYRVSEE